MKSRPILQLSLIIVCTLGSLLSVGQQVENEIKSSSLFQLDIGAGVWLENGASPSEANAAYATRPWGSWHIGFNWINNAKLSERVYLDWGGGVSWFNWQLEDATYQITKGTDQVEFVDNLPANGNPIKSKLAATYVGVQLIPMLDLGKNRESSYSDDPISKKGFKDGLRIGVGPYIGYRIGSRSKYVFKNDGKRNDDITRNHFFLENTRYGLRMQVGFREFEVFAAYDLNPVFVVGKGPDQADINNISVGFSFVSTGK
jgi:hypothetical protein